jgi:hypothetical protein
MSRSQPVSRVFFEVNNKNNFRYNLNYPTIHGGITIAKQQLYRIKEVFNKPQVNKVPMFSLFLKFDIK